MNVVFFLNIMLGAIISFLFLMLFAELSSANFKRLAPVLEAWDQANKSKDSPTPPVTIPGQMLWLGGWERLATIVWAFGTSIPLLAFAIAIHLFLSDPSFSANFVLGSTVGSNIIGLSLCFGILLISGPITFFRLRTITSPVLLLLATVVFAYVCLNRFISVWEGLLLIMLMLGYGVYFRRFSSEWKYYERTFTGLSLVESAEGILPILAVICMALGFFLLSVLAGYPFVHYLEGMLDNKDAMNLGVYFVALALSLPWIVRCAAAARESSTTKAITVTNISHSCLLNVLLVPGVVSMLSRETLSVSLVSLHLPVLLIYTGVFVSTLLIEKEYGGKLTWFLLFSYLGYAAWGWLA